MITSETPAKKSRNEGLKEGDPLLAGTISQALADSSADRFGEDDSEFLKFHGVYQQDDRDLRKTGKRYSLMVRTKLPGGVLSAPQYEACDQLATQYGNSTMRITTRQDLQFHGVLKGNLRQAVKRLNDALATTIGACGDVVRNVMAPPAPASGPLAEQVQEEARRLSSLLVPRTPAYHSIWIEGKELDLRAEANAGFADPFYGRGYLPRKFKFAFAIPPLNDIDVFANDAGFVAIEEQGRLAGYNVLAGGGMGMSHGNARTFPRLADVIGFIGPESEQVEAVAKAVVTIHRDFGDRANRRHARLKYVLAERGVEWFRKEMERRMGFPLAPPRPFQFTAQGDRLGWRRQSDGNYCLGLFVENGRIRDAGGCRLKSGLREAVKRLQPDIRLTPFQNILLAGLRPEQRAEVETVLAEHGIPATNPFSRTRLASMACPALPTCGQALAESERFLPGLLDRLEAMLGGLGLQDEGLIVRMTGCPNGCVRTYIAEIAFVGKAPDKYQIYVGGNAAGNRLARLYRESVKGEDLLSELRPLLARYAQEREGGERFGDYCARAIGASAEAAKH